MSEGDRKGQSGYFAFLFSVYIMYKYVYMSKVPEFKNNEIWYCGLKGY